MSKALEILRKWCRDIPTGKTAGNAQASWYAVTEIKGNVTTISKNVNAACHASALELRGEIFNEHGYWAAGYQVHPGEEEHALDFLKMHLSPDGPWKELMVGTQEIVVRDDGVPCGVIFHPDCLKNVAEKFLYRFYMNLMISLRMMHECPLKVKIWGMLKDKMNPYEAYFCTSFLTLGNEKLVYNTDKMSGSHWPFTVSMTDIDMYTDGRLFKASADKRPGQINGWWNEKSNPPWIYSDNQILKKDSHNPYYFAAKVIPTIEAAVIGTSFSKVRYFEPDAFVVAWNNWRKEHSDN